MKNLASHAVVGAALLLSLVPGAFAQSKPAGDMRDAVEQSEKAAQLFREIMAAPDKAIPKAIIDDAECVAVFPSVISVALGVGGRGGRGLASCRTLEGWSAPAYFNLGGGSVGMQIGAEATDLIMLFMTSDGINSLIGSKLELGADASVAAGPIGRQAGASTDLKLNAQILSYSRSKGLFVGVALKGAIIQPAGDEMRHVYGASATAKQVLKGSKAAPPAVQAFPKMLAGYSTRNVLRIQTGG
jgi:lipid-binding SYLF domain-containing protein